MGEWFKFTVVAVHKLTLAHEAMRGLTAVSTGTEDGHEEHCGKTPRLHVKLGSLV